MRLSYKKKITAKSLRRYENFHFPSREGLDMKCFAPLRLRGERKNESFRQPLRMRDQGKYNQNR